MMDISKSHPTPEQFLSIIETQTMIARLGLDLEGVMAVVADRTQVLTAASGAVVEVVEGDEMVYRAATGSASGAQGLRLNKHTSLSGLCVRERTTLRCADTETDPRVDREACRRVGVRSMIVAPLFHDDAAVGVLKVLSREREAFDDTDVTVLELMTGLIAAAMFRASRTSSQALFHRATHDPLTGLASRALFLDRLNRVAREAEREGFSFSVLMIDLDGFKQINDVHGHAVGDAALREAANRIWRTVRQTDTVARLGGDEFAAILRIHQDAGTASMVVERMQAQFDPPLAVGETELQVGASIGSAEYPTDGKEPARLLEVADRNMYAQKRRSQDSAADGSGAEPS